MTASKQLMERLHQVLAETLLERLEKDKAEDMITDAATLGCIRTFLKDNSITCDPADKGDLVNLRKKLDEASKSRRKLGNVIELAAQDVKEA